MLKLILSFEAAETLLLTVYDQEYNNTLYKFVSEILIV